METILIIEDNTTIRENLTEYLELEGYAGITVSYGKRGVALANTCIPDIILCDVLMQQMDGYEVLQSLLTTTATYKIPFIFSISMSEKVDRSEALRLGADDYIVKPFDMDQLVKMIKMWLLSGSDRALQNDLATE